VDQLPPDMNPDLFNFALAWIEYINRLAGMFLGILIAATAILAIRHYRRVPAVVIPAVLAAVLVAYQGWQGGRLVALELEPILVSAHMGIAFLIVSLLILATARAYLMQHRDLAWKDSPPRNLKTWLALIGVGTLFQVVLGTRIRGGIEITAGEFPLLTGGQWLSMISGYSEVHYLLAALLLAGTLIVVPRMLKLNNGSSPLITQTARGMIFLIAIQTCVGLILVFFDLPAMMQLFHLWIASLFVGMSLTLYATFLKPQEA
jgi:cytochrome c oxidase assembly protein subunit 15